MQGGDRGGPRRYAGSMTSGTAAAREAQDSTVFRALARIGYVVLGVLHIIIGAIAITIAVGGSGEADQSGAVEQVSRAPGGPLLLWVIAIALLALGAWQTAEAFIDWDADARKRWGQRAKHLGTAAAYFVIAVTATVVALGGQSDSSETTQSFSAQLLAAPGGVVLLVLVGLVVAGVGVGFIVSGIRRSFVEQLALPPGTPGRSIRILGTVGYIAKGIAVAIVGVLFVVAAVTHDPEKAGGLDAALKSLATLPFGQVILWLVGVGLAIYGVYCFARARYGRM